MSGSKEAFSKRRTGQRGQSRALAMFVDGISEENYLRWIFRQHIGTTPKIYVTEMSGLDSIFRFMMGKLKHESLNKGDRIVVVIDVDRHTPEDMRRFISECGKKDIGVFFSNPSFEVWLLDHYCDVTGNPDQEELEARLSEKLGHKYKKSEGITLNREMVDGAILRGYRIIGPNDDMVEKCLEKGPRSNLHILIDRMLKGEYGNRNR